MQGEGRHGRELYMNRIWLIFLNSLGFGTPEAVEQPENLKQCLHLLTQLKQTECSSSIINHVGRRNPSRG